MYAAIIHYSLLFLFQEQLINFAFNSMLDNSYIFYMQTVNLYDP